MTFVILMSIATLALTGIIRVIILYLLKRLFKKENSWKVSNTLTALLRVAIAVPQFVKGDETVLGLLILFIVYLMEQGIWFLYDYIQQRRNNTPAGWGMIWGVIFGGTVWMLIVKFLVSVFSKMLIGL
ncbi:MAG: hypothetical protein IJV97_03180 [Alphaproteobacteria bacterium]|nr:hypothetical protein [Alphaproteobacteria bacterium]